MDMVAYIEKPANDATVIRFSFLNRNGVAYVVQVKEPPTKSTWPNPFAHSLKQVFPVAKLNPIALWTPVAAIAGALIGSLLTAWFGYIGHTKDLEIHMVEIGIGILRAPPSEDIASIREWAINVIETNSGYPFTAEQRAALLKKQLQYETTGWYDIGSYYTPQNRPPPPRK
jgi:hypothetical protein